MQKPLYYKTISILYFILIYYIQFYYIFFLSASLFTCLWHIHSLKVSFSFQEK